MVEYSARDINSIILKPKSLGKAEKTFAKLRMKTPGENEISIARDGSSKETAIIINAKNEDEQIEQEYLLLDKLFDRYEVLMQAIIGEAHKIYDMVRIKCKEQVMEIWFDISQFHSNL